MHNMHYAPSPRSPARALATAFVCLVPLSLSAIAADVTVMLSGDQEVPPVSTAARGNGKLSFGTDGTVSGKITTSGIAGTSAHIHEAPSGKNGGVIIPLVKEGDSTWMVPAGAKLSAAQEASYKAGNLYVNVHSDAHKDGEIRGQIKP